MQAGDAEGTPCLEESRRPSPLTWGNLSRKFNNGQFSSQNFFWNVEPYVLNLLDSFFEDRQTDIEQICSHYQTIAESTPSGSPCSPLSLLASTVTYVDELDVARALRVPNARILDRAESPKGNWHHGDVPPLPTRAASMRLHHRDPTTAPLNSQPSCIPRFYYAEGKPLCTSSAFTSSTSKYHQNPHLAVSEGVWWAGECAGVTTPHEDRPALELSTPPCSRGLKRTYSLVCMEDEDVQSFVVKELSRTGAGKRLSRPLAFPQTAKIRDDLAHVALQRIVAHAFGLPKSFCYVVEKRLMANRGITIAGVCDYYERCIRFKSIKRRMFEVLVSSCNMNETGLLAGAQSEGINIRKRNYLLKRDFLSFVEGLLENHAGLTFLKASKEFQQRYAETVIIRIFFDLDTHERDRVGWREFEQSKLPDALCQLDTTDDINVILNYFSYEHFYVLYCRFWELNVHQSSFLSSQELVKYFPDSKIHPLILDRIVSSVGRKRKSQWKTENGVGYEDFVWFCLSEEDKSSPQSIRYWFRVLDFDEDGVISPYELETVFSYTLTTLECNEQVSFFDIMCQICDILDPPNRGSSIAQKTSFVLGDFLRRPEGASVALNMILSVAKFTLFERRDPFVAHSERPDAGREQTEWDRYARIEYDRMAAELER